MWCSNRKERRPNSICNRTYERSTERVYAAHLGNAGRWDLSIVSRLMFAPVSSRKSGPSKCYCKVFGRALGA